LGGPTLEVADIYRDHRPAWREAQRGHLTLAQLKVMSAIEQCRSAALGCHVLRRAGCGVNQISYNSYLNRQCPNCQSCAAERWFDARRVSRAFTTRRPTKRTTPATKAPQEFCRLRPDWPRESTAPAKEPLAPAAAISCWIE